MLSRAVLESILTRYLLSQSPPAASAPSMYSWLPSHGDTSMATSSISSLHVGPPATLGSEVPALAPLPNYRLISSLLTNQMMENKFYTTLRQGDASIIKTVPVSKLQPDPWAQ